MKQDMRFDRLYPQRARKQFTDLASQMCDEMEHTQEPNLKAMLNTSAEVLNGLAKSFSDYEIKRMQGGR